MMTLTQRFARGWNREDITNGPGTKAHVRRTIILEIGLSSIFHAPITYLEIIISKYSQFEVGSVRNMLNPSSAAIS